METELREDVNVMCNLSLGIEEEAMKKGMEVGREEGREEGRRLGEQTLIRKLYTNGLGLEQIAIATGKSVEDIKTIVEEKALV